MEVQGSKSEEDLRMFTLDVQIQSLKAYYHLRNFRYRYANRGNENKTGPSVYNTRWHDLTSTVNNLVIGTIK